VNKKEITQLLKQEFSVCPICQSISLFYDLHNLHGEYSFFKVEGLITKTVECNKCKTKWKLHFKSGTLNEMELLRLNANFERFMTEAYPSFMQTIFNRPYPLHFWHSLVDMAEKAAKRKKERKRLEGLALTSLRVMYHHGHRELLSPRIGDLIITEKFLYFISCLDYGEDEKWKIEIPLKNILIDDIKSEMKMETNFVNQDEIQRWMDDADIFSVIFGSGPPSPIIGETYYAQLTIPYRDGKGALQRPVFFYLLKSDLLESEELTENSTAERTKKFEKFCSILLDRISKERNDVET